MLRNCIILVFIGRLGSFTCLNLLALRTVTSAEKKRRKKLSNLFIQSYATPGRFHHDFDRPSTFHGHKTHRSPWDYDWGSHSWDQHNWPRGHHATHHVRTKKPSTTGFNVEQTTEFRATTASASPAGPTPPQPYIREVEIRLGQSSTARNIRATASALDVTAAPTATASDAIPVEAGDVTKSEWHVAIYSKRVMPYEQICGGSLVKGDVVLSAAHCFWEEGAGLQQAELFAAAAGKRNRPWSDPLDVDGQYADVKEINVPERFESVSADKSGDCYQYNIAVVRLSTAFTFTPAVKPVCVNFDNVDLFDGQRATIAGLTANNAKCKRPAGFANSLLLHYSNVLGCTRNPSDARRDPKKDWVCAGEESLNQYICEADSGSGLVYSNLTVPFLRGVGTFLPHSHKTCHERGSFRTYTLLRAHRNFLIDLVPDIENCQVYRALRERPPIRVSVTAPQTDINYEPFVSVGVGVGGTRIPTGVHTSSQWHVGVYRTTEMPFTQICGGSLIKSDIVLSAGHCFWTYETRELPPDQFAAAAGKRHRDWDDPRDVNGQYSYIKKIVITPMYQPCLSPDLAVLTLETPFSFGGAVKPVCLDFDEEREKLQLRKGNVGLIAGWAVVPDACTPSEVLSWSALPFIQALECTADPYFDFSDVDRVDKICAGELMNKTQCETDSGSGLAFLDNNTPYLRGVATFVSDSKLCYTFQTKSFTPPRLAMEFLSKFIPNLQECQDFYRNITADRNGQSTQQSDAVTSDGSPGTSETPTFIALPAGEENTFSTALGTGSKAVPTLGNTSAPSFQWHVGVYSKAFEPYMQICGGSLIKRDIIISAAHCFWEDAAGQQPAEQFAVAGGKLYRPWNDTNDTFRQQSDVSEIILPVRFRGASTSFQDDIALVRLRTPFTYAPGVQPACVDFTLQFDREQLTKGNRGTVPGWGLTKENGSPSQRLNYLDLPYVEIEDCFTVSERTFFKYITSDKICSGDQKTGKALCKGDSGGGLVHFAGSTPYLRGVASTAPTNENLCNAFAIATFTQLFAHRVFLIDNIPDVDKECEKIAAGNNAQTGNSRQVVTGNDGLQVGTGNGIGERNRDLFSSDNSPTLNLGANGAANTTGNLGGSRVVTTGSPFVSTVVPPVERTTVEGIYQAPVLPFLSQAVPYNHFVCNCNCKT